MIHKDELVEGKFGRGLAHKFWESTPLYNKLRTTQRFQRQPNMNSFISALGSCLLPATSRLLSWPPLPSLESGKHV